MEENMYDEHILDWVEYEQGPPPTDNELLKSYLHTCRRLGDEPDMEAFYNWLNQN